MGLTKFVRIILLGVAFICLAPSQARADGSSCGISLLGCSSAPEPEPIDVVLDLDGTLVYHLGFGQGEGIRVFNPNIGSEIRFGLAHGAVEFLKAIKHIPGVRISFFSAGSEWRNLRLVGKLMRKVNGFRLIQPNYSILSDRDLDYNGAKDLTRLGRSLDLNRVILIDDHSQVPLGQKTNVLKLYEGLGQKGDGTSCFTQEQLFRINNNLVRALGLILQAKTTSDKTGTPLRTVLYDLQWNEKGEYKDKSTNSDETYELGLQELKKYNSEFQLQTL